MDFFLYRTHFTNRIHHHFSCYLCGEERNVCIRLTKFILYTSGGSVFLLMGVLCIGLYGSSEPTLNFETLANKSYPGALEILFYYWFFIAFAVKSPIIPLHTWLPDTHGEVHYSTCMLLAGILLKMGAYGLIHINMEFFFTSIIYFPLG
uniref:NADH-plastoquinone oxidoreductase subunit 4 n=2 Tax=Gentiana TaxID=21496 RepID=A0A8F4XHF1_9GENT|nr:NADH-plastoquinone oxidoreductase subunit 4 [Gentiana tetraphylla]QXI86050.1 NADH-plastoquinone oxidoreductase subunit 4 [Gentiana viatrix]